MTLSWRVESIEGGKNRPNGRFSTEVDARAWALELAAVRDIVLVWRCTRVKGKPEEATLVARFQARIVEG
jgi:hypothetical protein